MQRSLSTKCRWLTLLCVCAASQANAQRPLGADTLSAKAIADSQQVLTLLARELVADRLNAPKWYRMGMVAWALSDRAKAPDAPKTLDANRLSRMADSSFRTAVEIEPKNVNYSLTMGRFLISSNITTTRALAQSFFKVAVVAARETNAERDLHAGAALEYGRTFWRHYEAFANRRMVTGGGDIGRSLSDAMQPVARGAKVFEEIADRDRAEGAMMSALQRRGFLAPLAGMGMQATIDALEKARVPPDQIASLKSAGLATSYISQPSSPLKDVIDLIENQSAALPASVAGATDLARADSLFRESYALNALYPTAFRYEAMVLGEKASWPDLELFSRGHVNAHPKEATAWLALGLALHRQGRNGEAAAVFDTALATLSVAERNRLDNLSRVVGPSRAQRISMGDGEVRQLFSQMFWRNADRSWSDGVNETRTEFLSRVTWAELRWTVEDVGIRGADTDRGDVYVRYGPPDLTAVIGPNILENAADIMTFWVYKSGLIFAFTSMSGFGTAHLPIADVRMQDAIKDAQPVRWDNLSAVRADSIVMQIARFRGDRDHVDFYIAEAAPISAIRATASDSTVRSDVWIVAGNGTVAARDSSTIDALGARGRTRRLARGTYLLRTEATARGSKTFARANVLLDAGSAFALSGAGMSDLLIAASAESPTATPSTWRELAIAPSVGTVAQGASIALVWENYELTAQKGSAQYGVSITIKKDRSSAGAVGAAVIGALASLARINRNSDRVVVTYEKTVPAASVVVDNVGISLGNTPPGAYTVTLEVTDRASGKTQSRSAALTIRE